MCCWYVKPPLALACATIFLSFQFSLLTRPSTTHTHNAPLKCTRGGHKGICMYIYKSLALAPIVLKRGANRSRLYLTQFAFHTFIFEKKREEADDYIYVERWENSMDFFAGASFIKIFNVNIFFYRYIINYSIDALFEGKNSKKKIFVCISI